jgi:lysyl-tRNA synthetase class 2
MARKRIMEVETPILGETGATDPNIESLHTEVETAAGKKRLYLQTSPEFCMKRLLAAGSGPIYQIARVFRRDESGRLHQPEFTMLEWYRPGFDLQRLMDEVAELLEALGVPVVERLTYGESFRERVGLDPHDAGTHCLVRRAAALGFLCEPPDPAALLDFLFSECVTPELGVRGGTFIYDFPAHQAALARLRPGDPPVAERFELFIKGMEIANGYHELADAAEQHRRFEADNRRRAERGQAEMPPDRRLLAALAHGLPDCSGVAMGIDRLLMVLTGSEHIGDVLAFPVEP